MALNASRNFAKMLVGQSCAREAGSASLFLTSAPSSSARLFQSSAVAAHSPLIRLPSLADTGVKLNAARWSAPASAETLSIFDTKGAVATLSSPVPPEAMTAGMRALADRVARAQQQQATVAGFRLFPDLTPGRAFMWGTIVAVWGVSLATLASARALGIYSKEDIPIRMREHLAPIKEWSRTHLGAVSDAMAASTAENAEALEGAHTFASAVKRNLRGARSTFKPEAEMTC